MSKQIPGSVLCLQDICFRVTCHKNNSELTWQSTFCDGEILIWRNSLTFIVFKIHFYS